MIGAGRDVVLECCKDTQGTRGDGASVLEKSPNACITLRVARERERERWGLSGRERESAREREAGRRVGD